LDFFLVKIESGLFFFEDLINRFKIQRVSFYTIDLMRFDIQRKKKKRGKKLI
jgi:hypothetical protein